MNDMLKPEVIEQIKNDFPKGTRVRVIQMVDVRPVPPGTEGTVIFVDGIGQIQVKWDNGSTLALVPTVDQFDIIKK